MSKLGEMYRQCAALCRNQGIACDDSPGGAVHAWVHQHCSYRPGTEFFIVLGICCAMADMDAHAEGYDSSADRAASKVFARLPRRSERLGWGPIEDPGCCRHSSQDLQGRGGPRSSGG